MFNPINSPGSKVRLINPVWWALFILISTYRLVSKIIPNTCRFIPSCSTYARDALSNYGALRSIQLITLRLLKCHPFNPGGFDYVPTKANDNKVDCCGNVQSKNDSSK